MNFIKNIAKELLRSVINFTLIFVILSIFVMPKLERKYGLGIDQRETAKLQAEKAGIALKEIVPSVYLTQEYPNSQGYTYKQSMDLRSKPAVMTWEEGEQAFWLGIANIREKENYKNLTLFLKFKDKVEVRVDEEASIGWVEMDPNFDYYINLKSDLQPLVTYRLNPLFVKFPEKGDYYVEYGVRGDNEPATKGAFLIKVRRPQ